MMKTKKNNRWRMVADVKLQGNLCLRVVVYWVICQVTLAGTIIGFSFLEGSSGDSAGSITRFLVPALVVSSLVLPLVLLDMLIFSNRFAGPILNVRRRVSELVESGNCESVRLRAGDYYRDLSENFNKLLSRIRS